MSSRLALAPCRAKACLATSRIRSRLRRASARGARAFRGGCLGCFLGMIKNTCNRRLSPDIICVAETLSVLLEMRRLVNSDLRPPAGQAARRRKNMNTVDVFGATSTTDEVLYGMNLQGKRILVTGVSAGLGIETARSLAAHGAHVVGAARDLKKAEAATAPLRRVAATAGGSFELVALDLASLKSVRERADALLAKGQFLDVVIANAGVMATPFGHTADGFETQFGTNHLGHFVLINRIAPLLRKGSRLINLSSAGHRFSNVDLDDPNFERTPYEPFLAYGRSKTANILFAVGFDRRHRGRGIRAAAVHPGSIYTELARHMDPGVREGMVAKINRDLAAQGKAPHRYKTVPQGAATSVWTAAVAPVDAIGG